MLEPEKRSADYSDAFRVTHYISSGPVGVECVHELHGGFQLVVGCYVE